MPNKLHLICNAHLDPVWLWEWDEGAGAAISTFRAAADFCEETEGFVFNHNEAILYQWVEEHEPALFERIKRMVKAGRWNIMGGWYLQPDCNMPSGESFVRQILLGKRYFRREFGVDVKTAINFDPFGHTRGLVQIMARCGYDSYLFCRPHSSECHLPSDTFVWTGYDGSEVLACRASSHYNSPFGKAREKVEGWLERHGQEELSICLWGVGNHGGGPSRKDLRDLRDLMRQTKDVQIVHSTPQAFFKELGRRRDRLPRHDGDINPFAPGCYTSMVRVKQLHRQLENEYYSTEKMATAGAMAKMIDYPRAQLDEALRDLLFSEFHDILPGSAIPPVEEASMRRLHHGLEILSRVRMKTLFAMMTEEKPAKPGDVPLFVYNPHPYPIRATIETEFLIPVQDWPEKERVEPFSLPLLYQNGKVIESQVEKEHSNIAIDWQKRLVFSAELAASQLNRFDVGFKLLPRWPKLRAKMGKGRFVFKTRELEVVINARTGLIDRYRAGGVEKPLLKPGACLPLVMADAADPWGTRVRDFRKVAGRFKLMSRAQAVAFANVPNAQPIRVIEDGDVRTVVEAMFAYGHSAIVQRYKLPKRGSEIEIETRVYWNEKDKMLKLSLPVAQEGCRYIGQVAYGVADLPTDGTEAVAHKWVAAVSDKSRSALTCINDGSYGSDFDGRELRLSLLRSPAYSALPVMKRPPILAGSFFAANRPGRTHFPVLAERRPQTAAPGASRS